MGSQGNVGDKEQQNVVIMPNLFIDRHGHKQNPQYLTMIIKIINGEC
jgi:hypothetical protein